MLKDLKLSDVINLMERLNEKGYKPYLKGKGNGDVQLIVEYIEIPSINKDKLVDA